MRRPRRRGGHGTQRGDPPLRPQGQRRLGGRNSQARHRRFTRGDAKRSSTTLRVKEAGCPHPRSRAGRRVTAPPPREALGMKKRMLIAALILGALLLATLRWVFDAASWAARPLRPATV